MSNVLSAYGSATASAATVPDRRTGPGVEVLGDPELLEREICQKATAPATLAGAVAFRHPLSRTAPIAKDLDARTGTSVRTVAADAVALPYADSTFDIACSAFGALPFVADVGTAFRELHRVLKPGGLLVFSVTHPFRWTMPDDPSPAGLRITHSYFDRTPYVEVDDSGTPVYAEHHRTTGDWIRELTGAGFVVDDLLEPEWPAGHELVWGGWGPERGP